jgi:hypothetical protein
MTLPYFYVEAFSATSAAGLVTAVNAFMATIPNMIMRRLDVTVFDEARRIGIEYTALLSYATSGTVIADPWQVRIDEVTSMATLETNVQAFLDANVSAWISGTQLRVLDNDANSKCKKWIGVTVWNADSGAYVNYGELVLPTIPH